MFWKVIRFGLGLLAAGYFLWVAHNALVQTPYIMPEETLQEALRALFLGSPIGGREICPQWVHDRYVTRGPDGKTYPTWHPPIDKQHQCYFDHEHGSDPHTYIGIAESGMPVFGYSAAQAGIQEPHQGYKVFVANDDLHSHAWMILINQDTSSPLRVLAQFHTIDWNISDASGKKLVDLHLMADFGVPVKNCAENESISVPTKSSSIFLEQHRAILTTDCARRNPYESWTAAAAIPGIFEAGPLFGVDNPITAVDVENMPEVIPTCEFRRGELGCSSSPWMGGRREILHPGQFVHNSGPVQFYTDAYGDPSGQGTAGAILQFVTKNGWDIRQCCGPQVVFRIQTYSKGVFIAAPSEPAGSAEFGYEVP